MALTQAQIDSHARNILEQIRDMQANGVQVSGELRHVPKDLTEFSDLHDIFDANVGWGDDIDALDLDDFPDVIDRVATLLRSGV